VDTAEIDGTVTTKPREITAGAEGVTVVNQIVVKHN